MIFSPMWAVVVKRRKGYFLTTRRRATMLLSPSSVLILLLLAGWPCEGETYRSDISFDAKFSSDGDLVEGNSSFEWQFSSDGNVTSGNSSFPKNGNSTRTKNDCEKSNKSLEWKFAAKVNIGEPSTIMETLTRVLAELSLFEQHLGATRVLLDRVRHQTAIATEVLAPYQRLGAKMYKLLDTILTYEEAKAACEAEGATLLATKDKATQDGLTRHRAHWLSQSTWLGLRKNPTAAEEQWVWSDGGPLGGWTQWGGVANCLPDPDWLESISISLEDGDEWLRPQIEPPRCPEGQLNCTYLTAEGFWYKASCDSKANGICQRPVPGCKSARPREVFRVERSSGMPVYSTWQRVGLDIWAEWNVQEVIVELFKDHTSVLKLVFDGKGSDHMSWFSPDNVLSAPWTDLIEPTFFSIQGDRRNDRLFFINERYYSCEYDQGWLAVLESETPPCAWERPHGFTNDDLPIILYSTAPWKVTWEQVSGVNYVGVADFVTVSIVECQNL
ncbi:uncharacterized protein LOC144873219 [Branchiostoma floridae x Branchiostoma japonicum]